MSGHILVVTEDDISRAGLCTLIAGAGYRVSDGRPLDLLNLPATLSGAPDLVVFDVTDEQGLLGAITGLWSEVPTLFLTQSEPPPAGASAVLRRPVDSCSLRGSIHRLLTRSRPSKLGAGPLAASLSSENTGDWENTDPWGNGEVASRIRAVDWSQTRLGPIAHWPSSLRTVLRVMMSSRYAMWLGWGPDLHFFYNDTYAQQTLGIKHPDALGKPAREVWREVWPIVESRAADAFAGHATWDSGLLLLLERSGYVEETYHTFSYSPTPGDSGEIAGMLCVVSEDTNRVISERHLTLLSDLGARVGSARTALDVFAALQQTLTLHTHDFPFSLTYTFAPDSSHATLVCSTPDRAQQASPTSLSLTDLARRWDVAALEGLQDLHVVPVPPGDWPQGPWPRPPSHALVVPIIPQGVTQAIGVFIAGLNPHRPIDDVTTSLARLFVGHLSAALSSAHAYELERRKAESLAELDRAKTAFFSNVSHEFRTPLTLMLGPTSDLLEEEFGSLTGEQRHQLELIHRNGLRLQKLVNTLLEFSRLDAGHIKPVFDPVDFGGVTQELASTFAPAVKRAGLDFEVDCFTGERVLLARELWERIVLNLLSNALKFTFEGKIRIATWVTTDSIVLQVEDTGIGIADDDQQHVFERFRRVEGVRSRTHEGSGIGLALIQGLVKLHGGRIDVRSTVGTGSTFTVTLPKLLATTSAPESLIPLSCSLPKSFTEEALLWLASPTSPLEPIEKNVRDGKVPLEPNAKRILLVEDNADMRDYVLGHLERYWQVITAEDGTQALALAQHSPPDLIVTDVMMPGLDGFQLLKALRSLENTRSIPVLMLSARSNAEFRVEGLSAGADDYIGKPFAASELVVRIQRHLELASVRRAIAEERDRFAALLGQAPAVINFLRGPDLIITYAHPLSTARLGGRPLIGKPLLEAVPELKEQPYPDLIRRVYETGERIEGRERHVLLDVNGSGRLRDTFWDFVYLPIHDESGAIEGVMTFDIEVTEQVLARRKLQEVDERYRRIVDQVQAGIAEVTLDGTFVFTNARYREILGTGASALLQRTIFDVVHPEYASESANRFRTLFESGTPFVWVTRYLTESNTPVWIEENVSRLTDAQGNPKGAAIVSIDITQRKFAEEALAEVARERQARLDEMERAVRFSEMFAGILGHDLRNPLSAIVSGATLIQLQDEGQKLAPAANRIMNSAHRMSRMISQLLDFTRIRLGHGLPLEQSAVDLSEIVTTIVEELQMVYQRQVHVRTLGEPVGRWDRDRLSQLISNLAGNACQHAKGDTPITVTVDGTDPDAVRVMVRNRGSIDPELVPAIFEPFRRALFRYDPRGSSGLGLGLYISQQIVVAHRGTIHVESNDEDGTVFVFCLPRAPAPLGVRNRAELFSQDASAQVS
jgi:PAS domain S-box-containing protein